jgi:hypothetical protein
MPSLFLSSYHAKTIQGALRCDCYTTQRAGGSCGHGLVMCQGRFLKGVRILGRCAIAGACWSNQPNRFPSLTPEHQFSGLATRALGFHRVEKTGRVLRDGLSEEETWGAQDRVTGQTWFVAPRLISAISVEGDMLVLVPELPGSMSCLKTEPAVVRRACALETWRRGGACLPSRAPFQGLQARVEGLW